MSRVRNKQKREALLQQANALLADMREAPAKKSKKKIPEEEPEAGLAELTVNAPTTGELSIHAPKPKPKKKAQGKYLFVLSILASRAMSAASRAVQLHAQCSFTRTRSASLA
jgi:hypothetical protein